MPKKPPRNNHKGRESRTVHSAGSGATALLQRITRRAQVVLAGGPEASGDGSRSWQIRLRDALPEEQRAHLLEVIEKPGELVLFADSAAWAGRIRLSLPELAGIAPGRKLTVRLKQRPGNRSQA